MNASFAAAPPLTLAPPPPAACSTGAGAAHCPACGWGIAQEGAPAVAALATRRVKRRETLYREGDRFHSMYAVRSGTFKSVVTLRDGHEEVTGFHMAGDLLGLDGVAQGVHATAATALEDSEILVLPYSDLRQLAAGGHELHEAISRLMSREIVREHRLMLLRGTLNATQKVAAFLLNMSRHMKERGYSPREFILRMTRAEIGSYLGLNLETVSRTFSDLQQKGLLQVDKRHVRIADMQALTGMFEARVH